MHRGCRLTSFRWPGFKNAHPEFTFNVWRKNASGACWQFIGRTAMRILILALLSATATIVPVAISSSLLPAGLSGVAVDMVSNRLIARKYYDLKSAACA